MGNKNLSVIKKIRLSYGSIMMIVAIIFTISIFEVYSTNRHTERIYNHPLVVRTALADLKLDIDNMSLSLLNMILSNDMQEMSRWKSDILIRKVDIDKHTQILQSRYLGPEEDVIELKKQVALWAEALDSTIVLVERGNREDAIKKIMMDGEQFLLKVHLDDQFETIDQFARNKALELYENSKTSLKITVIQLMFAFFVMIFLIFVLSRYIYRLINEPLVEVNHVISAFSKGNHGTRAQIYREDEFSVISEALNEMLNTLELEFLINDKSNAIIDKMMTSDVLNVFLYEIVLGLVKHTGGNLGAVYLLSKDQNSYDIAASIGMSDQGRKSFDAHVLEGDFGRVIANRKIDKFTLDVQDWCYLHASPYGDLFPKEIITIPVIDKNEVILIITIGSLNGFIPEVIKLIENVYPLLSTRVISVLNNNTIREIRDELEVKNEELTLRQAELKTQSIEINRQKVELEKQNESLNEVSRLKTMFLSNMSHELRTPLNSVIALSGVLSRRLKNMIPDEEYSFLEVIDRSGKNLLALINDILDISRIESGVVEVDISRFNLTTVIDDLIELLRPIAEQKQIKLSWANRTKEVLMSSDEQKLHHIIQNLMSNAVKFTLEGEVKISVCIEETYASIEISDTGIGIAKEHIALIFDEFRQVDGSVTRKFGGTGLGLAILKKYVEMLNGHIEVASIPGQGSVFIVRVPLEFEKSDFLDTNDRQTINRYMKNNITLTDLDKEKIKDKHFKLLIVEDNESAATQMLEALSEDGYDITLARHGEEALEMIEQNLPDGIILDIMMPIKDGFQVLKEFRIKEASSGIPILVLTAKHIEKDELRTLAYNNIHQLIQKGSLSRNEIRDSVASMFVESEKHDNIPTVGRMEKSRKPTVLLVEDNADNRLTVNAICKDLFYILESVDGESSIEMSEKHLPDLILMDIALPGIDGVEALKIIRKNPKTAFIPIIALTASALTTDREIFLAHGFDAFIPKPIIEKQFIKTISEVLYGK